MLARTPASPAKNPLVIRKQKIYVKRVVSMNLKISYAYVVESNKIQVSSQTEHTKYQKEWSDNMAKVFMEINSKRIQLDKKTGCIEWLGPSARDGRGTVCINNKNHYIGRLLCKIFVSRIRKNIFACHTCDNPKCINLKHLFLGTASDNIQDCIKKGRMPKTKKRTVFKFSEKTKVKIGKEYNSGINYKVLMKKYKISSSQLFRFSRGIRGRS